MEFNSGFKGLSPLVDQNSGDYFKFHCKMWFIQRTYVFTYNLCAIFKVRGELLGSQFCLSHSLLSKIL